MRVNPIAVNYAPSPIKQQKNINSQARNTYSQVPFKGCEVRVGGAAGGILGTLAGIGAATLITAATGGLGALLIGAMVGCGSGAIGGDIIESSIKGDDNNDSYGINSGDDYFYDRGV